MCDAPSDAPMETLHISPHQILHNSDIFVLTNTVIYMQKCLIFTQLMMVQVIMQPNNYCICTLPPSAALFVKKFILCGILSQQTPNK